MAEKETYCLQVGIHFRVSGATKERMKHMAKCKPYRIDSERFWIECQCGRYRITGGEINAHVLQSIQDENIFIRLD